MVIFKKMRLTLAVVILFLVGLGCGISGEAKNGKVKVVTTLFPLYDFAREIGKDRVDVTLLLPPGMEAHAYEPSPQDVVRIRTADLFVYTGAIMEPWAHKTVENAKGRRLVVVDSGKGIDLIETNDHDDADRHEGHEIHQEHSVHEKHDKHAESHHHEAHLEHAQAGESRHPHDGNDPHIWLDPLYAQQMVDNITDGLCRADRVNQKFYLQNAQIYKKKLQRLHEKFAKTLARAPRKKIIYGGHFAFGYFARRYGLEHISPYQGFAPDAEPTPQRIAELVRTMKQTGTKVIYYEELVEPRVAKVIAAQTGAKLLLLHGAHNVSKQELKSGATYHKIMENNLIKLKQGLGIQ